ncbi:MAG: hypothetical protein ACWGQW_00065 [bacterium]
MVQINALDLARQPYQEDTTPASVNTVLGVQAETQKAMAPDVSLAEAIYKGYGSTTWTGTILTPSEVPTPDWSQQTPLTDERISKLMMEIKGQIPEELYPTLTFSRTEEEFQAKLARAKELTEAYDLVNRWDPSWGGWLLFGMQIADPAALAVAGGALKGILQHAGPLLAREAGLISGGRVLTGSAKNALRTRTEGAFVNVPGSPLATRAGGAIAGGAAGATIEQLYENAVMPTPEGSGLFGIDPIYWATGIGAILGGLFGPMATRLPKSGYGARMAEFGYETLRKGAREARERFRSGPERAAARAAREAADEAATAELLKARPALRPPETPEAPVGDVPQAPPSPAAPQEGAVGVSIPGVFEGKVSPQVADQLRASGLLRDETPPAVPQITHQIEDVRARISDLELSAEELRKDPRLISKSTVGADTYSIRTLGKVDNEIDFSGPFKIYKQDPKGKWVAATKESYETIQEAREAILKASGAAETPGPARIQIHDDGTFSVTAADDIHKPDNQRSQIRGFIDEARKIAKVRISSVPEEKRGAGIGTSLYRTLVQNFRNLGYSIESDVQLTAAARAIWEKLAKDFHVVRGPVEKVTDPSGFVQYVAKGPDVPPYRIPSGDEALLTNKGLMAFARKRAIPGGKKPTQRLWWDRSKKEAPDFEDVRSVLPKDAEGDPDVEVLVQHLEENYEGKRWNQLTDAEKIEVYNDLVEATPAPADVTPTAQDLAGYVTERSQYYAKNYLDDIKAIEELPPEERLPAAQKLKAQVDEDWKLALKALDEGLIDTNPRTGRPISGAIQIARDEIYATINMLEMRARPVARKVSEEIANAPNLGPRETHALENVRWGGPGPDDVLENLKIAIRDKYKPDQIAQVIKSVRTRKQADELGRALGSGGIIEGESIKKYLTRIVQDAQRFKWQEAALEPLTKGMTPEQKAAIAKPAPKQAPIVKFRQMAAEIEASLPPVKKGFTRLWRGNRPGEEGKNPQFTNDLPGIALPFQEGYGGKLSYVDVPTADLPKYVNTGVAATNAEFRLPSEIAAKAKVVGGLPTSARVEELVGVIRSLEKRPGDWVNIEDLRKSLGVGIDRLHKYLRQGFDEGRLTMDPEVDQKILTKEQRASAFKLGNQDMHLVRVLDKSSSSGRAGGGDGGSVGAKVNRYSSESQEGATYEDVRLRNPIQQFMQFDGGEEYAPTFTSARGPFWGFLWDKVLNKSRFSRAGLIAGDPAPYIRYVGRHFFNDTVGMPDHTPVPFSYMERVERRMSQANHEFQVKAGPAYKRWKKKNGYLTTPQQDAEAHERFYTQVGDTILERQAGRADPLDLDPDVKQAADAYGAAKGPLLEDAKNPGKGIGKDGELRPLPFTEDLEHNPFHFSRVIDNTKVHATRDRYGLQGIYKVIRGSIDDAQGEIDPQLLDALSAGYAINMIDRSVGLGFDEYAALLMDGNIDALMAQLRKDIRSAARALGRPYLNDLAEENYVQLKEFLFPDKGGNASAATTGPSVLRRRIKLDETAEITIPRLKDDVYEHVRFADLFLDKNADRNFSYYARRMVGHIELARTQIKDPVNGGFLYNGFINRSEFDRLLADIKLVEDQLGIRHPTETNSRRWFGQAPNAVTNLEWLYRRGLAYPEDYYKGNMAFGVRQFMRFNTGRLLSNIGVAQAGESGYPTAILGFDTAVAQLGNVAKEIPEDLFRMSRGAGTDAVLRNSLAAEVEAMGLDVPKLHGGFYGLQSLHEGSEIPFQIARDTSKNWRAVDNTTAAIEQLTYTYGLQNWTQRQQQILAVGQLAQKIAWTVTREGDVNLSRSLVKRLHQLGIDTRKPEVPQGSIIPRGSDLGHLTDSMLERIVEQLHRHAEVKESLAYRNFPRLRRGTLSSLRLDAWDDLEARWVFENAAMRAAKKFIQEPDKSMEPFFGDTPIARAILQFRKFALHAYENQFLYNLHMADWRTLVAFSWSTMWAGTIRAMQVALIAAGRPDGEEYFKKHTTPLELAKAGFQRAGWSSIIPMLVDTFNPSLDPEDQIFNARISQQPTSALFGNPTADLINNALIFGKGTVHDLVRGDLPTQRAIRAGTRLLPWQNSVLIGSGLAHLVEEFPKSNK